ncbi:hypothetical protein K0J45_02025 [Shewanella alkalitolerans]|uniref:hypothetical protein n=1 Tax=Shewanella alkalitolerans TaxID=2864209 RepID=UPI001C660B5B|nr:hypothetical protein [Shewanella alkalitolerans]QYJ98051.1 hypothetical protein K0J45_02025 [Shewanella alkalitolerans]
MQNQQRVDSELMQAYGKMIAIVVLLLILGVLGYGYFAKVDQVSSQGLKLEHSRLLNVLAMVRSQWLVQGRPAEMHLDWSTAMELRDGEQPLIKMSEQGWPTLAQITEENCKTLWWQLLGGRDDLAKIVTQADQAGEVCSYIANNGDRLSYQLTSGRVIFLTDR